MANGPATEDIRIDAKLKRINPADILSQHGIDTSFQKELMDSIKAEGFDPDYPILSVDTVHGNIILDGHHRANASKALGLSTIPSYVIPYSDYSALLAAKFGSVRPKSLSDLDRYIFVRPQGSKTAIPYSQVRDKNDHSNS